MSALELIKGLIRPILILWGITLWTYCFICSVDLPVLIDGLVGAIIVEYFGERAIKRFTEKK